MEPSTEISGEPGGIWGPWATIGFGIVVIVVSLVVQAIVGAVFIVINMFSSFGPFTGTSQFQDILVAIEDVLSASGGLLVSVATCVSAIVCVGLIFVIIKVRKGPGIKDYLGFTLISGRTVLIVLAITAGFIILTEGLNILLRRPEPGFLFDVYGTSIWPALFWISVVVFAPAFEETFFRGFLFEGLRQSRIGIIGTIALTALGWAILHVQYGVYEIATIFFLGIVLGIVRFKTGSLWSVLLMHAFFNLIAMIELVLYLEGILS